MTSQTGRRAGAPSDSWLRLGSDIGEPTSSELAGRGGGSDKVVRPSGEQVWGEQRSPYSDVTLAPGAAPTAGELG